MIWANITRLRAPLARRMCISSAECVAVGSSTVDGYTPGSPPRFEALGDVPRRQRCVPRPDARRRGGDYRVDVKIWGDNEKHRVCPRATQMISCPHAARPSAWNSESTAACLQAASAS
jgi:hypothetical protein